MLWNLKNLTTKLSIFFILPVFLSLAFFCSSSSATSVTCQDAQNVTLYDFSQCDVSSLDSSKNWYYSGTVDITSIVNYSYLMISNTSNLQLVYPIGSTVSGQLKTSNLPLSYNFITKDHDLNNRYKYLGGSNFTGSVSNFTITDDLGSCPDCPDCPDVPVIPDNPYDPKLDEIIKAIYTVPAVLLAIYFFYCIYRMIIKGVK